MSHRRAGTVLCILGLALPIPGVAHAVRSYQGADYSEDFNAVTQVRICDNESDGRGAYVNYQITGTGSLLREDDPTGGQRGCGETGRLSRIYKHHACESINLRPDACGSYVYP